MTATFPNILLLALVGFACAQLLHSSCRDLPSRPSCKLAPPSEPHPEPPRQKKNSKTRAVSQPQKNMLCTITGLLLQSIPTHTKKKHQSIVIIILNFRNTQRWIHPRAQTSCCLAHTTRQNLALFVARSLKTVLMLKINYRLDLFLGVRSHELAMFIYTSG